MVSIEARLAQEISISPTQAKSAIKLLDEGATVPFIARYRKEATNGLDDTQLRELEERLHYLRELDERRDTILKSITEQDKLTPALKGALLAATTKSQLEDLYLPYKPKRRTKGQIAIEAGLEPLANSLLASPHLVPEEQAAPYVCATKKIPDIDAALTGARYILMERFAEDAQLLGKIRTTLKEHALLKSTLIPEKEDVAAKFRDYFNHQELYHRVASHRVLAMLRGRKEGCLQLAIELPENDEASCVVEGMINQQLGIVSQHRAGDPFLQHVVKMTWRVKIHTYLETELLSALKEQAEIDAINVFKRNLHDLLMASPAGEITTLGLDPGFRTGVKIAVVDSTGKLIATDTFYPHAPQKKWDDALKILHTLVSTHQVKLISIGNGTASRETQQLVKAYQQQHPESGITSVMISEAGASVYSASKLAADEFPNLDVSLRGAVSIARRVQDPLSELVKIDPKAIGVGQYQHDVNQTKLKQTLDTVVEDAVNAVGVDVNTASVPLLKRIAGLNQQIASNIIEYRDKEGAFTNRLQLKKVSRLGDKSFEQCAGFLKIKGGDNPLDTSQVHPEAYPIVESILAHVKKPIGELLGKRESLADLDPARFTTEQFGLPTVNDIFEELKKPGRDPRDSFKTAEFKQGVETLNDLKEGMMLEGCVTNVTNFGAFVDIGVHQDGLVHISVMANTFVKDPHDVVKAGQIIKVKVLEVDKARKRIALSMRLNDDVVKNPTKAAPQKKSRQKRPTQQPQGLLGNALQAALQGHIREKT